ncbi:GNAT family N-acetyltransferase [Paenibacillus marinisediminis]
MLRIISHLQEEEWDRCVSRFRDTVLWKLEYYKLYMNEGMPEAAVYETNDGLVFYPYLKRAIHLDWLPASLNSQYYDITTAYGFGEPVVLAPPEHQERLMIEFRRHFDEYCASHHIIAEFIRFQPHMPGSQWLKDLMEVEAKKLNVYVHMHPEWTEQDFLSSYRPNCRNKVKKAMRSGVHVTADETGEHLDAFMGIYKHTMDRRNASDYYYFSESYFKDIVKRMKGDFVLFHAWHEGRIISSELTFYDDTYLYSLLGGTLQDSFHLCPENLLKHYANLWAQQKGIQYYLLGGGYEENDGIFQYKRSFAPNNQNQFYIGKKTHNQQVYEQLRQIMHDNGYDTSSAYFPIYRANLTPAEKIASL